MKKTVKIFRTSLLISVCLLLLLLIIIQTRPFKDLLRDIIVSKANEMLYQAELSLDRIEGNYYNSFIIKGIRLSQNDTDVLNLKEISLHYSLRNLLQNKINVQQILLDEMVLTLNQDSHKHWNLQTLLPRTKPQKQKPNKPFSWLINIENFSLRKSAVNISTHEANSYIPSSVSKLNIHLNASYAEEGSYIQIDQFNFNINEPDLSIENIFLRAGMRNKIAYVDTMEIQTSENLVCASAEVNLDSNEYHEFSLNFEPMKISEFQEFIPDNTFKVLPEANLRLKVKNQKASLNFAIEQDAQKLVLSGTADSLLSQPVYNLNLKLAHFDGDTWFTSDKLDSDINLLLTVTGKGIKPEQAEGDINLRISPGRFNNKTLDSMQLLVNKTGDTANLITEINGNFGKINIDGNVENIFDQLSYQLYGSLKNCNLAPLLENDSLVSDINLSFSLKGKGTDPKTLTTDILLNGEPSSISKIELDKMVADIHYDSAKYLIRNMELHNTLGNLKLNGDGDLAGDHKFEFELESGNLQPLKEMIKADELDLEGNITGRVTLYNDDLNAKIDMHLAQLKYNDYSSEQLEGTIAAEIKNDELSGDISLELNKLRTGKHSINSVNLHTFGDENRIKNVFDVLADSLNIHCEADVIPDSIITIELLALNAEYDSLLIKTEHPDTRIMIGKNSYQIENLLLNHKDGQLKIAGIINPAGTQDFSVTIENLELEQLHNSGIITHALRGRLHFNAQLTGTFKQPELNLDIHVQDGGLDKIVFGDLNFTAELADNQVESQYSITRNNLEKISGSAKIPLYLDTELSKKVIPDDEQIEIYLYIKKQDIGLLKSSLAQVKKLEGLLDADIQLQNTLKDPQLTGNVTISKGKLSLPAWGINYPEIRLNASISNDNVKLKELYLKGGDGSLSFSGTAELEKPIQNGVKNIALKALAENFTAADKQGLSVSMNSNISLEGKPDNLKYGGYLNIPNAVIDIDKLPGSSKPTVDINSPLLVKAKQKDIYVTAKFEDKGFETQPDAIKNLRGELQINIPKNFWIRNNDMNIEIAGQLKIIKETRDFEIFGFVKTIRGKYELYGRKFELQAGTLTFNGGTQPDPYLDLNAQHIFRDINRNKRIIKLKVSGQATNPEVEFFLDEDAISETDAISYILFGRSSSEISQGQKSEVNSQTESGMALSFLSKQIGSKIASQIGKTLNLDVVEFSGGSNWKQASIIIGKYITNDLFINYKKEFSLDQSKEIVPDEVSLEYEFKKHFTVQATRGNEKSTGIDFFWKFEIK